MTSGARGDDPSWGEAFCLRKVNVTGMLPDSAQPCLPGGCSVCETSFYIILMDSELKHLLPFQSLIV